jgi:hypothetical protein
VEGGVRTVEQSKKIDDSYLDAVMHCLHPVHPLTVSLFSYGAYKILDLIKDMFSNQLRNLGQSSLPNESMFWGPGFFFFGFGFV